MAREPGQIRKEAAVAIFIWVVVTSHRNIVEIIKTI